MRDRRSYNEDPYAPISIHDVYGRSDYNFGNNLRIFGLYQPNFFHERWLHCFADGWSLGGTYEYHSGFPWTPTYPVTYDRRGRRTVGHTSIMRTAPIPASVPRPIPALELTTVRRRLNPGLRQLPRPEKTSTSQPGPDGENYFTPPAYTAAPNSAAFTHQYRSVAGAGYGEELLYRAVVSGCQCQPEQRIQHSIRAHYRRSRQHSSSARMPSICSTSRNFPVPTTSIISTAFGESRGALGSRTVELQSRFSF